MSLVVRPVQGRRDTREFIELPYRLHSTSPVWVPPLRIERRLFLNRRLNAFFKHGDAQLFLAERDGRVVGRISAHYDDAFNEFHANRWGMFGFLELEDDPEILPALLAAAEEWLRAHGRDRMIGPMDFTINDESGVQIEGFERVPFIKQPWHPPYYQQRCEEAGLTKAMDLLMWELVIADRSKMLPIIFKLADDLEPRHGITPAQDVPPLAAQGHGPLRRRLQLGLERELGLLALLARPTWTPTPRRSSSSSTRTGSWSPRPPRARPSAVAITVPDINQVLKRMNGRLLPFGWWHYLRRQRIIDRVRVGFLGVKPEYQHTGVAAKMYVEHFDMAGARPQKWGEMGWILETNKNMNRAMEAMGGRIVRRFRVYERTLASN